MTDDKELVARLRDYARAIDTDRGFESSATDCMKESADAIERLSGEVRRLNAECQRLDDGRFARAEAAEAEVERLKGANEKLLNKFADTYQTVSALMSPDLWEYTEGEQSEILDHLSDPENFLDVEFPKGRKSRSALRGEE